MKIYLLLFAHDDQFIKSKDRLKKQAIDSNLFDHILDVDTVDPPKYFSDFINENINFFDKNPRGYGNWLWKPFLVDYALNNILEYNDILVYLDSGCEISKFGHKIFNKYIDITNKSEGLFFSTGNSEKEWTKRDLFERLLIDYNNYKEKQIQATFFFLKKTSGVLTLIENWLNISLEDNYHFINDSESNSSNHIEFIEHRHDQSILSLLSSQKKYPIINMNMCFESKLYFLNSYVLNYPIHAIRNKSDISILNPLINRSTSNYSIFSLFRFFYLRLLLSIKRKF